MKNDSNAPTIIRFEILPDTLTFCSMPQGSVIMDVLPSMSAAGAKLNGWAMVDPKQPLEKRFFAVYPSGKEVPHGWDMIHRKTVLTAAGPALHVMEVPDHIAKKLMKNA